MPPALALSSVTFSLAEVARFAVVLLRVGGIMVFAPVFSSTSFPAQMRVIIALVAALVLCPALPLAKIPVEMGLVQIVGISISEFLFGMVLGLAASFLFAGMQLAGQVISFQLGFSIVNLIDPQSQVETSVFSFLQYYIGILFFLLIDGHHWFFQAVSDSFNYLPVGGLRLSGPLAQDVIRLSAQVLTFGLQLAAPVIVVTLVVDVVLGLIARAAPQINILIVGMPVKILVGFFCMSVSFLFLPRLLGEVYMTLLHDMSALLRRLA
jgi:flagellar biosynthetic protein FliR